MSSPAPTMDEGHRPTTRERLVVQSVETLAPHQSLDRIDKASATVTTAVTLAGTLAGGFGLIAATTFADVGIGWALPTVILAACSIACAVLATVPAPATVAPGDLSAVEAFFRIQIRRRGRLVRGAAWSLAVAVLLAPLPIVASALANPPPRIALVAAVDGKTRRISVAISGSRLKPGAAVKVTIVTHGETIALSDAQANASGEVHSAVTAPSIRAGSKVTITVSGSAGVPAQSEQLVVPSPN